MENIDKYIPIDVTDTCLELYENLSGNKYISAAHASEILDVSRTRITQMINEGKFNAIQIGRLVFISIHEAEHYNRKWKWEELTEFEGC